MTLDEALKVTNTRNMTQLAEWFIPPKTKQAIQKWDKQEIPPLAEREIYKQRMAIKAERAEARRLKGVHKIDN